MNNPQAQSNKGEGGGQNMLRREEGGKSGLLVGPLSIALIFH